MEKLAGGNWISVKERNPEMYGKYRVLCVQKGKLVEDEYLWNGSYWVTGKGSPSKGVESWWEEIGPEEAAEEEKAAVPAVSQEMALSLADYEARIYLYKEQIGTGYIGIGRTLNEAKEAKVVPHGQWEDWVTRTTGLTPRQAQRCMQAATEIRDGSAMARLEMSKALLLLSSGLDEETREEIAGKAADEGATVKDLREQLKQAKLKLMQETGAAVEIREELKRTESERASLQNQIKATIQGYQDRMAEVEDEAYRRGMKDGDSELRQMLRNREDRIRELNKEAREKLQEAKQETERAEKYAGRLEDRLDEAEERHQKELAECDREAREEEREAVKAAMAGLQNELNGKKQYADELKKETEELKKQILQGEEKIEALKAQIREGAPADYAADREILLEAAANAEARAANAEAELEALKAAGAGQPDPAWKILKKAIDIFMADCELLAVNDVQGLLREEKKVQAYLGYLESWVQATRKAMDDAVPAEGVVE